MTITERPARPYHVALAIEVPLLAGRTATACIEGITRDSVIDALLWYAVQKQAEAFTLAGLHMPIHADAALAHALNRAEALCHYVWHQPFATASDEGAAAMVRTAAAVVPELAPLAHLRPDMATLHEQMGHALHVLGQRMAHPAVALLGVEGMMQSAAA